MKTPELPPKKRRIQLAGPTAVKTITSKTAVQLLAAVLGRLLGPSPIPVLTFIYPRVCRALPTPKPPPRGYFSPSRRRRDSLPFSSVFAQCTRTHASDRAPHFTNTTGDTPATTALDITLILVGFLPMKKF